MICTLADGESLKLVFGSCRISAPHEPPYTLSGEEDERGLGVDALYAMAMRLRDEPVESLPRALVLLGDQIYSHKPPFDTLDFIRSRRDTGKPPGEEVASFEEYAHLYRDSWGDPAIRWLLSTAPSAMIFDDHEVADDWNISDAWVEETRNHPWWNEQISGGHVSYWIYQHLGDLSLGNSPRTTFSRGSKRPKTRGPSSASSPTVHIGRVQEPVGASTGTLAGRGW